MSALAIPPVVFAAGPDSQAGPSTGSGAPLSATGSAIPPSSTDPTGPSGPAGPAGPRGGKPSDRKRTNRILIWVAAGLVLVLVLVGLFFLGTRLPAIFGAAATPTPTAAATKTPTPTPTPTPEVTGPAAAGEHPWDQLGGGECVDPFTGPWAETFTVVDCAAPHAAQLVYRGSFGGDATTPFPGEEALASQINVLCSAPGVIDMAAAGAFPGLQLQGSYPVTEEQWTSTQRYYYCFVSRADGQPITASIAGPGPAA